MKTKYKDETLKELHYLEKEMDIFISARKKLVELKKTDHHLESLTLHFQSDILGSVDVKIMA